jgi:3-deoxy-D-manno-octulosonic-acid transferase
VYAIYSFLSRVLTSLLNTNFSPLGKIDLWFHAASVGEVAAVSPLIELFLRERTLTILLTTMTETGLERAKKGFNGRIETRKFPYDSVNVIREVLIRSRPRLLVIVETELWPNLIVEASRLKIPIVLVNGRMGKRSFLAYRIFRREMSSLLSRFSLMLLQTERDMERFVSLGAPKDRVKVVGSLKFDLTTKKEEEVKRADFGFFEDDFIVVFGSIHSREEEEILKALRILTKSGIKAIVAPRHLDRVYPWKRKLEKAGVKYFLKTKGGGGDVMILDTVGELQSLYSIGDVAFVGGTLAPYGGHNLLEPAALGKPVLFGPHTFNTEDAAQGLLSCGGGILIKNSKELIKTVLHLTSTPSFARRMGENAEKFVKENRGICVKVFEHLKSFL